MFTIRPATISDASDLLELIHGLAEDERLTHLATAPEATL
jgi:hypothetical protein